MKRSKRFIRETCCWRLEKVGCDVDLIYHLGKPFHVRCFQKMYDDIIKDMVAHPSPELIENLRKDEEFMAEIKRRYGKRTSKATSSRFCYIM